MTTSPGHFDGPSAPNPSALARSASGDDAQAAEQAINDALARLDEVRELSVAEHVERFEAVHGALTDALNKAENFLAGNNNGS